ncbi:SAV_2336 N-terminal domain-related protein [Actinomadura rubteroloni]|nr:SAV_2336 N-terminal domain-related protein [Actinomadura rubteroloni]
MLWLAAHLPASQAPRARPEREPDAADPAPLPAVPPPPPPEPPAALHPRGAPTESAGDALSVLVPTAPMLPDPLAVQRALRPLKRRIPSRTARELDEEATAARIADTGRWSPVMVPAPERWLTLTLVVDTGPTMGLWRPLARELAETLVRQGAFRDVRVVFLARSGRVLSGGRALDPSTLLDPTGRHAILVLSDCSGPHWWDGGARRTVRRLASAGPVAILQPLPERLWRRTAAPTLPGLAALPRPAAPNRDLRFVPYDGDAPDGLRVPVLHAAPRWFAGWARLLAGGGPEATAVAVFPPNPPAASPVRRERDLPIGDRVRRFLTSASPEAAELAAHVAVSEPSLPVMRLIQRRILGASGPAQLAEVLLSGLLRPVAGEDGRYAFVPGARDALLATLPRPAAQHTRYVLRAISAEIKRRAGTAAEHFPALLHSPGGTHTITTDDHEFAHVGPGTRAHLQPGAPRTETVAQLRCAVAAEIIRSGDPLHRTFRLQSILLDAGALARLPPPDLRHDGDRIVATYPADVGPRQIMGLLLPALRMTLDGHNKYATERVRLRVVFHAGSLPEVENVQDPAFERLDLLLRTLAYRESLNGRGTEFAFLASDELVGAIRAEAPDADVTARLTRVSVADGVTAWFGSGDGEEDPTRTIVFADVTGFSSPHRTEGARHRIRQVMFNLLRGAFDAANVVWNDCHVEDRGDGMLIVAPPGVLADALLAPMLPNLAESLRRHNERSDAPESFQLRVALDTGVAVSERNSLFSTAIIEAARMLDAPEFKQRAADSNADLAFITSEALFEVLIDGSGRPLVPSRFTQVPIDVKGEQITARMRLWDSTDDEPPAPVAASVALGRDNSGEPVVLDPLADGPHGLILGAMEERGPVLRTIVAALPPAVDVIGLALGESAFTERTGGLVRVASELLGDEQRRNALLAMLVGELDQRRGDARVTPPLVIIVDLSLTLPTHLPELIRLLRQIASSGAAVGVHLILAATELENTSQWNSLLPLLSWRLAAGPITPRDSTRLFSRAIRLTPGAAYLTRADEPGRVVHIAQADSASFEPPRDEAEILRNRVQLARALFDAGDLTQAREAALAALDRALRPSEEAPENLDLREQAADVVARIAPDDSVAVYRELVRDSERLVGKWHADTLRRRLSLRSLLLKKGPWEAARSVAEEQIQALRDGATDDPGLLPTLAGELIDYSSLLFDGEQKNESLRAADEAFTLLLTYTETNPQSTSSTISYAFQRLSDYYWEFGRPNEAVATIAKAADFRRRLVDDNGNSHASLSPALFIYAERLEAVGKTREALDALAEALANLRSPTPLSLGVGWTKLARTFAGRLSTEGADAPIEALRTLVPALRSLYAESPDYFRETLGELLEDLGGRLVDARRWADASPVIEEAVQIRREQHGKSYGDASALLAADLVVLGRVLTHVGRIEDAVDSCTEAVRLFRDLDDGSGQARAVSGLGVALRALGRFEDAREHFRTAASIARDADDLDVRVEALADEARTFAMEQRDEDAVSVLREAADICREAEEPVRESTLLNEIGRTERVRQQFERAVTAHREAFHLAQRIGDRKLEAEFASELVRSLIDNGGLSEAAAVQRHAIDVHRVLKDRSGEADGWRRLGRIENDAGHVSEAAVAYAKAIGCFVLAGNRAAAGEAMNQVAEARLVLGDGEDALDAANDAVVVFRDLSRAEPRHDNGLAHSLFLRRRIFESIGRPDDAAADEREALQIRARLEGESSGDEAPPDAG